MDSPFFLFLVGFLYIILFGGLSLLRREGLSMRFAIESIGFTALFGLIAWLTQIPIHPAIFLFALYLVTMRVRFLVDIANLFARRRDFVSAEAIYNLAGKLWPDATNQLILAVNRGALRLQQGALEESITIFKTLLQQSNQGFLGIRYESAAHYNLGIAYHRSGMESQAIAEFNIVLDIWPASEYSRAATRALARYQQQGQASKTEN